MSTKFGLADHVTDLNKYRDEFIFGRWRFFKTPIVDLAGEQITKGTISLARLPPIQFTKLVDVPHSYAGRGGQLVAIKQTEDGLEFVTGAGSSTLILLPNLTNGVIKAGQPVTIDPTGAGVVLASATAPTTLAIGMAAADIAPGTFGNISLSGIMTQADWTTTIGSTTLAIKGHFYLSTTPGQLTQTPPTGYAVQFVGDYLTPQAFKIAIGDMVLPPLPDDFLIG